MRIVGFIAPRIDPWRTHGRLWWAERSRRERALLTALSVLLAVAGVVMLLIRPLQAAHADALASLRASDAIQARLLSAGPSPATPAAQRSGDVAAIVAASAPSFGITVATIAATGTSARLRTGAVAYDALIRWLDDLGRTSPVRIDRLAIARGTLPGTVIAELDLSQ